MPLTEKEKKYFFQKISTYRKGLQMLEEELAQETPPPRVTKKNQWMEHFKNKYELGIRTRPTHTAKLKKVVEKPNQ